MSFCPDFPYFSTDLGVIFDQVGVVEGIRASRLVRIYTLQSSFCG